MYLGLGVDATQIQTQYPMHPTQKRSSITHTYGTITLYGATIPSQLQLNKKRPKSSPKHHISTYLTVRDSVCPTSFSLAVTNDIAYCFLFLHLLRCFNSVGSQSSTDQTPKLNAAYHDLHRQLKPSYPPDSTSSNIFQKKY